MQSGVWSARRTGVGREERDLSAGASGIQRGYSGVYWGLIRSSIRAGNVYPIIPEQDIKIGRHWSGVGQLSGVNEALLNGLYKVVKGPNTRPIVLSMITGSH